MRRTKAFDSGPEDNRVELPVAVLMPRGSQDFRPSITQGYKGNQ